MFKCEIIFKMFRFLSSRKARHTSTEVDHIKSSKNLHKNLIQCRVILLDGTDLSVELSVSNHSRSVLFIFIDSFKFIAVFFHITFSSKT